MDYKQKYEQALGRVRTFIKRWEGIEVNTELVLQELKEIFPELEETEDERIRKYLIGGIKHLSEKSSFFTDEVSKGKVIAWLEKQGEQKLTLEDAAKAFLEALSDTPYNNTPITEAQIVTKQLLTFLSDPKSYNPNAINEQKHSDKIEPKFKVGDWIVEPRKDEPDYLWHINRIENNTYWYDAVNGGVKVAHADKNYHLWTIQDVKDGDILEFADHGRIVIGIVSHVNKVTGKVDVNCLLEENNFKLGNYYALDTIKPHPATKEQCNLLFQKLEEAGYEWDSEKRELKKIEQEQTELPNGEDYGIDGLYHAARILEKTLGEVEGYQSDDGILEHKCAIEAVKRLYKQKPTWSKEDEEIFNETLYFINEYQKSDKCKDENGMQNSVSCEKWLHAIKNRLTYEQEN